MPTVAELKKICKSRGIKGYSKLKKKELEKLCLTSEAYEKKKSPAKAKKAAKYQEMIEKIYKMWKTIEKAGIELKDFDEYYMLNPKNWRTTPEDLLDMKDYALLKDSYKETKRNFKEAKADLKKAKKPKKAPAKAKKPSNKDCEESSKAKYKGRPGPPIPANECKEGEIRKGNNGQNYIAKKTKKGYLRWVKQ